MNAGLVPAPKAGDQSKFLRTDNMWAMPSFTEKFLCADGTWKLGNNNNYFLRGDAKWNKMNLISQEQFSNMSWDEIDALGKKVKENPDAYNYMIGFTKDVIFDSPINKTVMHEIIDICHTDYGTNHAFIFMPKEQVLGAAKQTSGSITNKKYTDSLIDAGLQPGGIYWPALPIDLVAVMKDCNIKYFTSTEGTGSWAGVSPATITRKWFLPAIVEVGLVASANTNYNNEGTVFARFASASNNDRIRRKDSSAINWWLRSLGTYGINTTTFGRVYIDGSLSPASSSQNYYFCPCFAV